MSDADSTELGSPGAAPFMSDRQRLDREATILRIANVLRDLFYGREPDGKEPIGAMHADRARFVAMARAVRRVEWSRAGKRRVLWWI
jgi:hypothetical protein